MTPALNEIIDAFQEAYGCEPAYVTMAPGRLEFLGNHTDYNGGCVLGVALDLGVYAAISERGDTKIRLATRFEGAEMEMVESDVHALDLFADEDPRAWVNYPLGVLSVMQHRAIELKRGFDIAFWSNLPVGSGLSSSAAIELASLRAISVLYDIDIDDPLEMSRIARKAENDFVGVPCGIFDQGVSAHGKEGNLVYIDCKQESFALSPFPHNTYLWIFNTNVAHANVDSKYSERHDECMGARQVLEKTYSRIQYLCDVSSGQVEPCEQDLSSEQYKRALHITKEHERVKQAAALLASGKPEPVGQLLNDSHESSKNLFENSIPELDFLVENLQGQEGVYGARLTGGGFGGSVFAWTHEAFTQEHADAVAAKYAEKFGEAPTIYKAKTGDGAKIL